jgi:hypothetical protein
MSDYPHDRIDELTSRIATLEAELEKADRRTAEQERIIASQRATGEIYVVWWRTAGEKNFGDGPTNWVGAWTSLDTARAAQMAVAGDWINTGIVTLALNADRPTSRHLAQQGDSYP